MKNAATESQTLKDALRPGSYEVRLGDQLTCVRLYRFSGELDYPLPFVITYDHLGDCSPCRFQGPAES